MTSSPMASITAKVTLTPHLVYRNTQKTSSPPSLQLQSSLNAVCNSSRCSVVSRAASFEARNIADAFSQVNIFTASGESVMFKDLLGENEMVAALDMLKKLDSVVPVGFVEDLGKISDTFLTPFSRLMKKIKGPAYKPPKFENIKPLSLHEEDPKASVAAIPSHDVIEMTQPSQHVSQPPIPPDSSSRPPKIQIRRMRGEKWSIIKSLDVQKRNKIYDDWGWGIGKKPKLKGGLTVCGYHISEIALQSLAPCSWVDDRIIYCYMGLLREREEAILNGKIWDRKPVYYFMDPYFIVLGWDHMKKIRRAARKGKEEERKAWHEALRSFNGFATSNIGPSVDEADYIFIPCCVSGVHWILFMISTKTFDVILLDSMSDEPTYAKEIQVVEIAVVSLLRHFGCPCCWELASALKEAKARFDSADVKLIAIGVGGPEKAQILAERLPFPMDCLYADPERKAYDVLGLYHGFGRTFFNPASAKVLSRFESLKQAVKNYSIEATPDDRRGVLQQGGMFVFKGNEMIYSHKDEGTGDHAPLDEIFDICCRVPVT